MLSTNQISRVIPSSTSKTPPKVVKLPRLLWQERKPRLVHNPWTHHLSPATWEAPSNPYCCYRGHHIHESLSSSTHPNKKHPPASLLPPSRPEGFNISSFPLFSGQYCPPRVQGQLLDLAISPKLTYALSCCQSPRRPWGPPCKRQVGASFCRGGNPRSQKQAVRGWAGRYGTERADRRKVTAVRSVPGVVFAGWEFNRNLLPADTRISSLHISASLILGSFPGKSWWIATQLLIPSVSLIPKQRQGSWRNKEANPFPSTFTSVQTQAPRCSAPAAPNIQLGHIPPPSVGKPSEQADKQVWPAGNKQ